VLVWGLMVFAPFVCAQAAVYVYVDAEGTAHFTDAPTKTYFRLLPAFGLPRGINLTSGQYADLINAIATQNGVDPALIKAIIRAESGFDQRAVSRKGAQGLMQLMPQTADRYAVGTPSIPATTSGRRPVPQVPARPLPWPAPSGRCSLQRGRERRPALWRNPTLRRDAGLCDPRLPVLRAARRGGNGCAHPGRASAAAAADGPGGTGEAGSLHAERLPADRAGWDPALHQPAAAGPVAPAARPLTAPTAGSTNASDGCKWLRLL